MSLSVASKSMCESLCRKRISLEESILGRNSIDVTRCIKICRELAKD